MWGWGFGTRVGLWGRDIGCEIGMGSGLGSGIGKWAGWDASRL